LCYLVFQLFSHKNLYDDQHSDVQQSVAYPSNVAKRLHARTSIKSMKKPPASSSPPPTDGVIDPDQQDARSLEAGLQGEEEIERPEMSLQTTIVLLIAVTVVCRWLISLT
jgi:Ca2+:H+ antiporter